MKDREARPALRKKGEIVIARLGTAEVRAVVVRDESAGRPLVLRTEDGRTLTAFSSSVTSAGR